MKRSSIAVAVVSLSALLVLSGCGRRGLPEAPAASSPDTRSGVVIGEERRRKPRDEASDEPFVLDFLL